MDPRQIITAGIDGSPESLGAAHWAAREAVRREVVLHLVHAFDRPSERTHLPEIEVPFHRESGALERAVLHLGSAHPALGILEEQVTEPPVQALLTAAESSALLVLGSRGLGAFTGALVGSVALAVAARAACPIVLVRADEHPEAEPEAPDPTTGERRPVVLGLDIDGPSHDELLEFAFLAAGFRAAPLHVLHTWAVPLVPSADATDPARAKSHRLAEALAPYKRKYPQVDVAGRLIHGLAGHSLLKAAAKAQLLILGRRATAGPHLGSVTHTALHHATCPVAVVPHPWGPR
ncbi:universal stress protein [Streptomyces flavofungini]|uniref:universal stress protein n=1 Tax=Streptomyces flavofungini TaxID=68200 RepID=UPI0034DE68DF